MTVNAANNDSSLDSLIEDTIVKNHNQIIHLIDEIKSIEGKYTDQVDFNDIESTIYIEKLLNHTPGSEMTSQEIPDPIVENSTPERDYHDPQISGSNTGMLEQARSIQRPLSVKKKLFPFQNRKPRSPAKTALDEYQQNSGGEMGINISHPTFILHIDKYGNLVGFKPKKGELTQQILTLMERIPLPKFITTNKQGDRRDFKKIMGKVRPLLIRFTTKLKENKMLGSLTDKIKNILPGKS